MFLLRSVGQCRGHQAHYEGERKGFKMYNFFKQLRREVIADVGGARQILYFMQIKRIK